MIDTSDMDPELARYLNRNYWQQKSVEIKASTTQPSAPSVAAESKVSNISNSGGGGSTYAPKEEEVSAGRLRLMAILSEFESCCNVM